MEHCHNVTCMRVNAICTILQLTLVTRGPRGRFRTAQAQRRHSANIYFFFFAQTHKFFISARPDGPGGHSANYCVVYPGNTPENHPPTEACMIHSKQHRGCRIQDPETRGKHQTKTTPTAEISHSARTAHGAPPKVTVKITGLEILIPAASAHTNKTGWWRDVSLMAKSPPWKRAHAWQEFPTRPELPAMPCPEHCVGRRCRCRHA